MLSVVEARGENQPAAPDNYDVADLERVRAVLGLDPGNPEVFIESLPFSLNDTTSGCENELQAAVIGDGANVDLPIVIRDSNYYKNTLRRTASGDAPRWVLTGLEEHLRNNRENVWENSWVRFPRNVLSTYAAGVFERDLLADKRDSNGPPRADAHKFVFFSKGNEFIRVPLSYLLKLSLADAVGESEIPPLLRETAERFMRSFLNDNTSPETISFHPPPMITGFQMGEGVAEEASRRYLLCQLLTAYANKAFQLLDNGQEARVYFAPHPPLRQKQLNDHVSDHFYRELFMSPCLCGWDQGEKKHRYMGLCHEVLSRSQLNAVVKLKEARIITNNLVVLPNMSNTSLANNGVHISLGSRRLTAACGEQTSGFGARHEKYLGDLATKIMEHFLPLFVTTFSAAPYRLEFADFHPERALGFLPHELDFTHLRMLWRRWKKKASLSVFGHALTPFGPPWLDRSLSRLFALRGDLVPDFRLIDYPVAFLSTEQSPAYNGRLGNQELLKGDLADMGVFDRQMSLYQFFKLREFATMGFSGFEGRHYSIFPDLEQDLGGAANLQALLCALAFKYMANGQVRHRHIPDTPFVESERRQIFFGLAIGIPTFYVHRNTRNRFLLKILKQAERVRTSRRYPAYFRVYHQDYCRALLKVLREDAADLIEMFRFAPLLEDLERRIEDPRQHAAAGRMTREIAGGSAKPLRIEAEEFNRNAELFYRDKLRCSHMEQALNLLRDDLRHFEAGAHRIDSELRPAYGEIMEGRSPLAFLLAVKGDLLNDTLDVQPLVRLLNLMLLSERRDQLLNAQQPEQENYGTDPSIHRALQRSGL